MSYHNNIKYHNISYRITSLSYHYQTISGHIRSDHIISDIYVQMQPYISMSLSMSIYTNKSINKIHINISTNISVNISIRISMYLIIYVSIDLSV